MGRISLAGHAGLSGPSPLEIRELDSKEIHLVLSIFVRGLKVQERVLLLLPSAESKEALETTVLEASLKDD